MPTAVITATTTVPAGMAATVTAGDPTTGGAAGYGSAVVTSGQLDIGTDSRVRAGHPEGMREARQLGRRAFKIANWPGAEARRVT